MFVASASVGMNAQFVIVLADRFQCFLGFSACPMWVEAYFTPGTGWTIFSSKRLPVSLHFSILSFRSWNLRPPSSVVF